MANDVLRATIAAVNLVVSLIVCCLHVCTATAADLRAAAMKVDITPPAGVIMWGYADRVGPATGTRDPLYAKVLLLDDGNVRLAWVTLDLGRPFGLDALTIVRDRVQKTAGVTHVSFSASHTHSGPTIHDFYAEGQRPEWETAALDKIAAAIENAQDNLEPARIGTGTGSVAIGHNRRLMQPDGSIKMFWRNATKIPTSPVDTRVGIIRLDSLRGKTIAVLVNYACHPVVFGPDNLQFSADFPGAMSEVVEGGFGSDCVCLFLQGAAGDTNPYYDKSKLDEGADALMRETGGQLGEEALRVAQTISPTAPKTPEIQVAIETRRFKPRYDLDKMLSEMRKRNLRPEFLERYEKHFATPMDCPVTTVLINREIALMGMPGEPFVEFGLDFRERAPATSAFFAGYCNHFHGYFPTIRAAVEGGYGAEGITARVEVGVGEQMVNTGIVRLLQMQGLLKDQP